MLDSDFAPSEILLHLRDPAELKKNRQTLLSLSTRGKKGLRHELLMYSNGIQKISCLMKAKIFKDQYFLRFPWPPPFAIFVVGSFMGGNSAKL